MCVPLKTEKVGISSAVVKSPRVAERLERCHRDRSPMNVNHLLMKMVEEVAGNNQKRLPVQVEL